MNRNTAVLIIAVVIAFNTTVSAFAQCPSPSTAVTTYHNDNLRTGWNCNEKILMPSPGGTVIGTNGNVGQFGLLASIPLDNNQVDAQPLFVPQQTISAGESPGTYDVVYVATAGNTIYAIDANSGNVVLKKNFGTPVPYGIGFPDPSEPNRTLQCPNNGPNVGITGTPVIDATNHVMYVIIYTFENGRPIYRIHALDLSSLVDKVPPVVVTASHTVIGGTFNFMAQYQRQRPALLLANGNVYAGFGSFCDYPAWKGDNGPNGSRGWLLGWSTPSLTPLVSNKGLNTGWLNDTDTIGSGYTGWLSSIWMSGFGIASDPSGALYFVTGNSDGQYDGVTNFQESVVKMDPSLTTVEGFFTPGGTSSWNSSTRSCGLVPCGQPILDGNDQDFGSGGALLLPPQGGFKGFSPPPLAVAAGKDGFMFLLNRDNLGGFNKGSPNNVLDTVNIGGCWCGPSYFSQGTGPFFGRIVSSGGQSIKVWGVVQGDSFGQPVSSDVALMLEGTSKTIPGGGDPGGFTSISSDGETNAIIWAVSRPTGPAKNVSLYAFNATPASNGTLTPLFEGIAGTWPSPGSNANIVPVVANGKVFVASYNQLNIFGLGSNCGSIPC